MKFGIALLAGLMVIVLLIYVIDLSTDPAPRAVVQYSQGGGIPVSDQRIQSPAQSAN